MGEWSSIWPGHPTSAHCGCEAPNGETEEEERASFETIFAQIQCRIEYFLSLGETALAPENIKETARKVGEFKVD